MQIIVELHFVEYKYHAILFCTLEDRFDRFSRNAEATNWIEVMKLKQFGVLDNKSLIRRFVVWYR